MSASSAPAPLRILLVEDNPGDVYLMRTTLTEQGLHYTLEVLPDGQAAIDFFNGIAVQVDAPAPDLILLDLTLPRVEGMDVLRHIKSIPQCAHIFTVILSGLDTPTTRAEAMQLGADAYILKPGTLEGFEEFSVLITTLWHRRPPEAE
jgi:CheY-like chemotaxis protein